MKSSTISYDNGKFILYVENVKYTDSEIKFTPYIKVTNKFKSEHTATVSWKKPDGSTHSKTAKKVKEAKTYFSTSQVYSNKDEEVTITAKIGNKKATVTLHSTVKPSKPELRVVVSNDYRFNIYITGSGKAAAPTNSLYLYKKADREDATWEEKTSWNLGAEHGSYSKSYVDQDVSDGHRYKYQVKAHNVNGYSSPVTTEWLYTSPASVSDVQHIRQSNSTNVISWHKNGEDVEREIVTKYRIFRSVSGSAWIKIADVPAGAAVNATMSYSDTKCTTNEYYKYKIASVNSAGQATEFYPSDEGTEATYNTPSAPLSIKATHTMAGKNCNILEINNPEKTATELQIQKYQNSEWIDLDPVDETDGPVTDYTDRSTNPSTVTKYRARNYRNDDTLSADDRASSWKESNVLQTLSRPNPPTLISPANNALVQWEDGSVKLQWIHNPTDGTEQYRYFIDVCKVVNGELVPLGSYPAYVTTSQQYHVFNFTYSCAVGDTIAWRVKTMGEYIDPEDTSPIKWYSASEFSPYFYFKITRKPGLTVDEPDINEEISNLPIEVSFTYIKYDAEIAKATIQILFRGKTVYTRDISLSEGEQVTSYETRFNTTLSDYSFINGESYVFRVKVVDELGQEVVEDRNINITYVPVELRNEWLLDATPDSETGYVTLTITTGETVPDPDRDPDLPEPIVVDSPVSEAYLYRIYRGERTFVKQVYENEQFVDKYAPLNVEFTYELVETAENGNIAIVTQECTVDSIYWYIYYGSKLDYIAKAKWNPTGDVSLNRPERQQIRYSGRTYPVSYDSEAQEETNSFTAAITDRETLMDFRDMIKAGAQGLWKSADGDVFMADFEFGYSANYSDIYLSWNAKLDVTRIESEAL